jgi:biotin carboxyl carrier protein
MPDYEVVIGGRTRKIELTRRSSSSYSAKIDGKSREVKLPKEGFTGERTFVIDVDGKTYKLELPRAKLGKKTLVKVEDSAFNVEVKIAQRSQVQKGFEQVPQVTAAKVVPNRKAVAEGAVTAPMTGKIVQVKVGKGDQVKAGQILCVIEAMKMENEISAPKAGTVQQVNVEPGAPVSEGETLFVIA